MAELNEITNREHDRIAGTKRVTLFPATAKRLIDTSVTNIIYIGVAAPGTATSITAWLIEKVDSTVSNTITITHATDAWDNRASSAVYT